MTLAKGASAAFFNSPTVGRAAALPGGSRRRSVRAGRGNPSPADDGIRGSSCLCSAYRDVACRRFVHLEFPSMPFADVVASQNEPSELSPSGPYRTLKQAGLVLLCTAWIALGLFGHDPWKADDATSFGIAFDMLKSGDWIIPQLAGSALPERAPLFYALAAAAASAFQAVLPLHDAARIAIALCLGLTLWLLALTGRELYGPGFRWLPVLIFIGCIGLWDRSHQLSPDLGLLPAFALALYALALAPRRAISGGALLGGAMGLAFLFKGSAASALIALTAVLLPLFA